MKITWFVLCMFLSITVIYTCAFETFQIPARFLISAMAVSDCSLIIEMDEVGNVIRNLRDGNGKRLLRISEVEDDGVSLYIGSYFAPFVGRVNTHKKLEVD